MDDPRRSTPDALLESFSGFTLRGRPDTISREYTMTTHELERTVQAGRALRAIRLSVEDHAEHGQADITLYAVASILEEHYGVELNSELFLGVLGGVAA